MQYFKKHWPRYMTGLVLVFIATFLNTLIPRKLGDAIDALSSPVSTTQNVKEIAVVLAFISVLAFIARFIWRYLIVGFCRYIEFYLREKLFEHLQRLTADYYVMNNTGDIITRAIVDVQAIRMMLGFGMISIIDVVVTTVMSVINMSVSINIYFTMMALAPIPFLILIIMKARVLVGKRYLKVQESISNISSKVQENITGIRVIKAFSQEEKEGEAFNILSNKKLMAETKLARAFAVMNPSVSLAFGFVFSVFLAAGGSMVAKGSVTLGEFVSFNTYLALIMAPIGQIGKIVDRWQRGITSMKRLDNILLTQPSVDDTTSDRSIKELANGRISVRNLDLSLDGNVILSNISFEVPPSSTLAIMGPTGSGKSKILELIIRLWQCEENMIYIDGHEIASIPLNVLRNNCAFVPQDTFLFSDTILENIRFYDKSITDEQVYEAAKAALVHESILDFPAGYQTVVGERGMTLSGGQKQRIALARALVTKPKILLLDDCMSAVDAETEKNIIKNLKTIIKDCTTVIVTHRIPAAALADHIVLLKANGSIDEAGTHRQLLAGNGSYKSLVESIQAGEVLAAEDGAYEQ